MNFSPPQDGAVHCAVCISRLPRHTSGTLVRASGLIRLAVKAEKQRFNCVPQGGASFKRRFRLAQKKSRPANGTAERRIAAGSARGAFSALLAAERVPLHLSHKLIVDGRLQPIFQFNRRDKTGVRNVVRNEVRILAKLFTKLFICSLLCIYYNSFLLSPLRWLCSFCGGRGQRSIPIC